MRRPLQFASLLLAFLAMGTLAQAQKSLPLREKLSTSGTFTYDDPTAYYVFVTLQGHDIRVGDEIDGVDAAGHRMTFKVTLIKVENTETDKLETGQLGELNLKVISGSMRDFGGDYYLVDKGANLNLAPIETGPAAPVATVTAQLGGAPWRAAVTYKGALFYQRGNTLIDDSGKPFLQLAFKTLEGPDDRQLTLQVRDFDAAVGKVPQEKCEVLLSGSADGDPAHALLQGYMDKGPYKKYVFSFTVTKWERVENDKAILSGTFSGKLKGTLGAPDIVVNNGAIEGIVVEVITARQ